MVIKIQPKQTAAKQAIKSNAPAKGNLTGKATVSGSILAQSGNIKLNKPAITGAAIKTASGTLAKSLSSSNVNKTDKTNGTVTVNKANNESLMQEAKTAASACDSYESTVKTGSLTAVSAAVAMANETGDTHYDAAFNYYTIGSNLKSAAKTLMDNGSYEAAKEVLKEAQEWLEKAKEEAEKSSHSKAKSLTESIENSIADCKSKIKSCEAQMEKAKDSSSGCNGSGGGGCSGANKADGSSSDDKKDKKKNSWGDVLKNGAIALGSALIGKALNGGNNPQAAQGAGQSNQSQGSGKTSGAQKAGVTELKNKDKAEKLGLQTEVNEAERDLKNAQNNYNVETAAAKEAEERAKGNDASINTFNTEIKKLNENEKNKVQALAKLDSEYHTALQESNKQQAIMNAQQGIIDATTPKVAELTKAITTDEANISKINDKIGEQEKRLKEAKGTKQDISTIANIESKLRTLKDDLKRQTDSLSKHKAEKKHYEEVIKNAKAKRDAAKEAQKTASQTAKEKEKAIAEKKSDIESLTRLAKDLYTNLTDENGKKTENLKTRDTHLANAEAEKDIMDSVNTRLDKIIEGVEQGRKNKPKE